MLYNAYIVETVVTSVGFGLFTDQWWGADTEVTGDGSPVTPPAVRRQIGELVIPWPSGVVMTVS